MEKKWQQIHINEEQVEHLQNALKIHPVLCQILVQRGITTFDEAKSFFRPQLADLHDPFLMKDMDIAVQRIQKAIHNKEKVLVYGDYDVDGTTAVACMFQFFKQISKVAPEYYIPHRYREGYGVSKQGIDYAAQNGFTLIISLDCGIKSVELVAYAKTLGIEFIICDHHLPDETLPNAVAILNPKQTDCSYPYKELCGCGVGFKLITALATRLNIPFSEIIRYLDLTATAIAADIVPITGENRIMAYYGIQQVNTNPSPGIKALIELSGLSKATLSINNLVFVIAPRVNAAGRMDDAKKAVQLFIEHDYAKALELAAILHSDNDDRKEADSSITEEALAMIEQNPAFQSQKTTLVYQPHWHKGVVGIVASRLIEKFYRPTIVLTESGEYAAGSARSVPGFNLYEAIHACRQHLLGYGGHFAAAGMTLKKEAIPAFAKQFEEVVADSILPEQLIPVITIDAEILLSDIKPSFYNIICQMEPFGPDNMKPVFLCRKVMNTGHSKLVKEQHVRLSIKQNNSIISGIGFNMPQLFPLLELNQPLDIVFTLDENEWNGEKFLQIKLIDLRISE